MSKEKSDVDLSAADASNSTNIEKCIYKFFFFCCIFKCFQCQNEINYTIATPTGCEKSLNLILLLLLLLLSSKGQEGSSTPKGT